MSNKPLSFRRADLPFKDDASPQAIIARAILREHADVTAVLIDGCDVYLRRDKQVTRYSIYPQIYEIVNDALMDGPMAITLKPPRRKRDDPGNRRELSQTGSL
jgi:hypothetical protein